MPSEQYFIYIQDDNKFNNKYKLYRNERRGVLLKSHGELGMDEQFSLFSGYHTFSLLIFINNHLPEVLVLQIGGNNIDC